MALIQVNADFSRLAAAAERLCLLAEWMIRLKVDYGVARQWIRQNGITDPKQMPDRPGAGLLENQASKFSVVTDEDLWNMEQEEERLREQGLPLERSQSVSSVEG